MNQALTYLYYIYDKFINLVFNQLEIAQNVSVGWIIVAVIIFAMLIRNILNLPRSMGSFDKFRDHETMVRTYGPRHNLIRTRYVSSRRKY